MDCATTRPQLPDLVNDGLEENRSRALREHLLGCAPCSAEVDLLRRLSLARTQAPPGLESRIQAALRSDSQTAGSRVATEPAQSSERRTEQRREWRWFRPITPGLAAAAVLVLALGTTVLWPEMRGRSPQLLPVLQSDDGLWVEPWSDGDGIIAGAPVLEELTDEQLLTLLEELEG